MGAVQTNPQLWEGIEPNGTPRRIRLHIMYPNDADHFQLEVDDELLRIDSIVFEGELILDEKAVPARALQYGPSTPGPSISEVAKFEGIAADQTFTFELHRIPESGHTHVLLRRGLKAD
jgi:hypothetical protein